MSEINTKTCEPAVLHAAQAELAEIFARAPDGTYLNEIEDIVTSYRDSSTRKMPSAVVMKQVFSAELQTNNKG